MKFGVIVFPGSNCDHDAYYAAGHNLGQPVSYIWHDSGSLGDVDAVILPGGFAYGDYLRCGAMAAHSPIMRAVRMRAAAGTPVLGICNGFQILTEAGLLPGALLPNCSLRFSCRDADLLVENNQTIFTCGYRRGQTIRLPVAHHDGNYTADRETLDRLEGEGRVAFRYCDRQGRRAGAGNFNGSANAIAGILNAGGTVLGLMPHPENATDPLLGSTDGTAFFTGLAGALR